MKIVCVGDCGIDHYTVSDERRPGGITHNFALQARRCFAEQDEIHIIAPLGGDAAASVVRQHFLGKNVECRFTDMPGHTPVQSIEIDAHGERRFVGYDEGVLRSFRIGGDDATLIQAADLLVAPVFEQNHEMFASLMAVPVRGMTAIDFADFAEHPDFALLGNTIEQVDVGFFGLRLDQTSILRRLRSLSAAHSMLFVVTLGADGSRVFHGERLFECEARHVEQVVDTTGAGDAFAAGFLSHYCRTSDIDAALSNGARVAAATVQHLGAI